jgi:alkaline phosphatase D
MSEIRTAPNPKQMRNVKLAIASCQSYEGGFYSAYRTLLNEDAKAAPVGNKKMVMAAKNPKKIRTRNLWTQVLMVLEWFP